MSPENFNADATIPADSITQEYPNNALPLPTLPDPYGATATEPITHDVGHDGAAASAARDEADSKAVASLANALAAVETELTNLGAVPGHDATGMARSGLLQARTLLQREAGHVGRVIIP